MGFLRAWAPLLPLSFWKNITAQQFFLPFYHSISDSTLPHLRNLYQVRNVQQFEKDLDFLLRHFKAIDLQQLILNKNHLPKNTFWLSFDDGLYECRTIIAPILLQKGVPATFFINSAFVDSNETMFRYKASWLIDEIRQKQLNLPEDKKQELLAKYQFSSDLSPLSSAFLLRISYAQRNFLDDLQNILELDFDAYKKENPIYMSSHDIQWLINQGFSIGSHSIDHPQYKDISLATQITQTKESQLFINEKFNISYRVFAFPFTDDGVKNDFFEWAFANNGGAFDFTFGGAGLKREANFPLHLQRFPMETQQLLPPKTLLHTEYAHYFFKRFLGKHVLRR